MWEILGNSLLLVTVGICQRNQGIENANPEHNIPHTHTQSTLIKQTFRMPHILYNRACSPCMVSLSSVAARRRAHQLHDCRSSAASDSCAVQAAVLAAAWCRSCIRVQETFPERTFHPRWLKLLISCTIPPSLLSESLSLWSLRPRLQFVGVRTNCTFADLQPFPLPS